MDIVLKQLVTNLNHSSREVEDCIKYIYPEIMFDPKYAKLKSVLSFLGSSVEELKVYDTNFNK